MANMIYSCRVVLSTYLIEHEPNPDYHPTCTIPAGTFLNCENITNNEWLYTSYNLSGKTIYGYVRRKNVDTTGIAPYNSDILFGTSTLKYSSSPSVNRFVFTLQWALKDRGFNPGTVDGLFGKGTDSAVRAFQKEEKLKVDGLVGSGTKAALCDALGRA